MTDNSDQNSPSREELCVSTKLLENCSGQKTIPLQALGGDPARASIGDADLLMRPLEEQPAQMMATPVAAVINDQEIAVAFDTSMQMSVAGNDGELFWSDDSSGQSLARRPVLTVGIGASAAGLDALHDFFDHMSVDSNAAFIVVQHVPSDFDSLMAELLARNDGMPVENVVHGVEVLPNTIYLIPEEKNITLVDGCLYLSEQLRQEGAYLPIDHFFRSLAIDAKHRAVGVILSGTGGDGSRGIKSIKEAGGLILVQGKKSPKFDGMPFHAARTSMADFVLPAGELADHLSTFLKNSMVSGVHSVMRTIDNSEESVLRQIFALLKTTTGIDFAQYRPSTVARRIERRMGIKQVRSQCEYLRILQASKTELEMLGRELLINVTSFFRDDAAWEYLAKELVKPLLEQGDDDSELRFWVAGCSTGEEAYTLAIITSELMSECGRRPRIKIFATDVDAEAIAHASTARYREEIAHDMSSERLRRNFIRVGMEYEIRPDIRKMVVFATHNMINDPPFSSIDLITCRNVLIYFQQTVQRVVMSAFHFSLKDNAQVFLGSSESVGELKTHFKVQHEHFCIYRKMTNTRLPISNASGAGYEGTKLGMRPVSSLLRSYRTHANSSSRLEQVKGHLINDSVPSGLKLNSEHELGASNFDSSEGARQRIRDLENELLHTQECLQLVNEELETSKEELQAVNEELMSSTEELQSTNVELQSVYEELRTVNCEHQKRLEELMVANDEMNNILTSSLVGIVSLDAKMHIRQYTSVAAQYFNLLLSDVGRPLHHISNELEYAGLFEDIETVNHTRRRVCRDVLTVKGESVHIKLLPYSSSAFEAGTTITLIDSSTRQDAC